MTTRNPRLPSDTGDALVDAIRESVAEVMKEAYRMVNDNHKFLHILDEVLADGQATRDDLAAELGHQ